MKIAFWYIGKSTPSFVSEAISQYEKRLNHYCIFERHEFPYVKNAAKLLPKDVKKKESEMVLAKLQAKDKLFVLDEKGKEYASRDFASQLENWSITFNTRLVFLVGGAFGTDELLWARAQKKISLGKSTYSHQIIRIMFMEQLYRACTILNGEKYHND